MGQPEGGKKFTSWYIYRKAGRLVLVGVLVGSVGYLPDPKTLSSLRDVEETKNWCQALR